MQLFLIGDAELNAGLDQRHLAIAAKIGLQWSQLAGALGLSPDNVWKIQKQCNGTPAGTHSKVMLKLWMNSQQDNATGT